MTGSQCTGSRQDCAPEDPEHPRQRLIRAATVLFLSRGVAATSVKQITDRADISGSFFTHFKSKRAICDEVADLLCAQATARVLRFHPRDSEELMNKLVTWTEVALARPGWVRLELEITARSDPDHRSGQRSAARSAQLCNAIAALLDTVRNDTTSDTVTEVRAAMVWSTIAGFVCRNAHNREVSRAAIEQHISNVVRFALT